MVQCSLLRIGFRDDSEYCKLILVYFFSAFLQYLLYLKQTLLLNPVTKEDHFELNAQLAFSFFSFDPLRVYVADLCEAPLQSFRLAIDFLVRLRQDLLLYLEQFFVVLWQEVLTEFEFWFEVRGHRFHCQGLGQELFVGLDLRCDM